MCASKGKKLKGETTDYESFRLKISGKFFEGFLSWHMGSKSETVICAKVEN